MAEKRLRPRGNLKLILDLIIEGYTNPEIAVKIGKAKRTVDDLRMKLLRSTNTRNTGHLVAVAFTLGWVKPVKLPAVKIDHKESPIKTKTKSKAKTKIKAKTQTETKTKIQTKTRSMIMIPMVDYVLQTKGTSVGNNYKQASERVDKMVMYALLLKRIPTLGYFVPVDENWKVLSKPKKSDFTWTTGPMNTLCYNEQGHKDAIEQYAAAQNRVIYKGFEVQYKCDLTIIVGQNSLYMQIIFDYELMECTSHKSLEDLIKYNIELTRSGKSLINK